MLKELCWFCKSAPADKKPIEVKSGVKPACAACRKEKAVFWREHRRQRVNFAVWDGDLNRVKYLVSIGLPFNEFDEIAMTPLHYAAKENKVEIARFFLEQGVDVNSRDEEYIGNTPLRECAETCSFAMASLLIEYGADPTIPGWMALTAIDITETRIDSEAKLVRDLLIKTASNQSNKSVLPENPS